MIASHLRFQAASPAAFNGRGKASRQADDEASSPKLNWQ